MGLTSVTYPAAPPRDHIIRSDWKITDSEQSLRDWIMCNPEYRKYLRWCEKQVDRGEPVEEVTDLVEQFDKRRQRLEQRDLYQYKTLGELRGALEDLSPSRQNEKERARAESDVLYDDGRFLVVHPRTAAASCHYGRGTRWCISATQTQNWFYSYAQDDTRFYFVIDREAPPKSPLSKVAVTVSGVDGMCLEYSVFDATDTFIGNSYLEEGHAPVKGLEDLIVKHTLDLDCTEEWLAKNSDDEELLRRLAKNPYHRQGLLLNEDLPEDVQLELVRSPITLNELCKLFESTQLARGTLEWLYENPTCASQDRSSEPEQEVYRLIAKHENTPTSVLTRMANNPDVGPVPLAELSANSNTPPEIAYEVFQKHISTRGAAGLARNHRLDADRLLELAKHPNSHIREVVYATLPLNPYAPEEAIRECAIHLAQLIQGHLYPPNTDYTRLVDSVVYGLANTLKNISVHPRTTSHILNSTLADSLGHAVSNQGGPTISTFARPIIHMLRILVDSPVADTYTYAVVMRSMRRLLPHVLYNTDDSFSGVNSDTTLLEYNELYNTLAEKLPEGGHTELAAIRHRVLRRYCRAYETLSDSNRTTTP